VSPFISFAASAVRLPKRNEQGRLCGKEKGSLFNASSRKPARTTLDRLPSRARTFSVMIYKI
jgi:hypothetical protein